MNKSDHKMLTALITGAIDSIRAGLNLEFCGVYKRLNDLDAKVDAIKADVGAIPRPSASAAPPKLCKDCKHAKPSPGLLPFTKSWQFAECMRPGDDGPPYHLIDGKKRATAKGSCAVERKTYGEGKYVVTCGEDAKFFEPR